MARPIWSGSISFGLVTIPVKLYNAVSRRNVSFNQIDSRTGSRIRLKKVSAADGSDVNDADIVKGYELTSGNYVTIAPEELDALDPVAARTIEIEEFVDLDEIDPIFYDSPYYLVPDATAAKPYALLERAMEASNKVGIARFVMRSKQYLAAIRPAAGHLVLSTMVYADEVVPVDKLGGITDAADIELSERELNMARQLIESLATDFEPSRHRDTYRDQVLELIERKAAGEEEVVPVAAAPTATRVVDLMAALEASVREAKAARGRHPTARAAGPAADVAEPAEASADDAGAAPARPAPAATKRARAKPAAPAEKAPRKAAPARPRRTA